MARKFVLRLTLAEESVTRTWIHKLSFRSVAFSMPEASPQVKGHGESC